MVKTEPNFNIQQHLGSGSSALSQQSAAENSQQSADNQHDQVVVELQHFVTASAEATTAAQIILVRHATTGLFCEYDSKQSMCKQSPCIVAKFTFDHPLLS